MKKTKITVQTDRVLVIRRRRRGGLKWCESCAARVEMMNPEEAAAVSGLSLRAIFRLVEASRLHFTETAEGLLWVCFNSLLDQMTPQLIPEHSSSEE
jgi:hypothetical protein